MQDKRDLTPGELKVLKLVKIFDDAVTKNELVVTLHGSKEAAEMIARLETKHNLCKTLKVDYLQNKEKYSITFTILEYYKYVQLMLRSLQMELRADGSIKTFDNYVIPNHYLDQP